jgi:2-oxoglutarate ferredoxin oxidoreductase subunit delta
MSGSKPARPVPEKAAGSDAKTPPRIEVRLSWCKGCGLCVAYCNRGVLEMRSVLPAVVHAEKCSRCLQCEAICPDFAIRVLEDPQAEEATAAPMVCEGVAGQAS